MHLFVSDDTDLPDLREALLALPRHAYGQVFIETFSQTPEELERPAGMAVTWLVRDPTDHSRPVGSYAAVASGAWAAEWMTSAPQPAVQALVWVGVSIRASVHVLMAEHGCPCLHRQGHQHTRHEHTHGQSHGEEPHGSAGRW